ncbi:MAG: hypothetical protein R3Y33_06835 [Clostridia bacterium]
MGIRIGIGKKIGGVYVGASTNVGGSEKKGGSGCFKYLLYFILLPVLIFYVPIKWAVEKTKQQLAVDPNSVWYKQNWGIVLVLFCFFPIGLYLMWKYANWKKTIKISISVIIAVIAVFSLLFAEPKAELENGNNESLADTTVPPTPNEVYSSVDLLDAFDDDEKAENLIGQVVKVTGVVEYNALDTKNEMITLETTQSNLDGSIYCEMSEFSDDYSAVTEGDKVVIVGTVEKEIGHIYMVDCWYLGGATEDETKTEENISQEGNSTQQFGTTEDMDVIVDNARTDAETATQEDIDKALNWLNDNNSHLFDGKENMELAIYNGELIEYFYKDSDDVLTYLGFKAFETVKYVYRGVDSTLDEVTHDNLMELKDMLAVQFE